ncbi:gluconokinase [Pseudoduganella sp. RAF53_2]|jgi:carbohydrate kinase (thermoresistant glucokinase family)|uniref:gluconokinase n=1 Tax=unclassified Pseudoduganella TaxID=2637179 RepID=UPI003F978778
MSKKRWVMMGVSGCGKSLVGKRLAENLSVPFLEGDTFHSPQNVAKMRSGVPLNDADRAGWLASLAEQILKAVDQGEGLVLSCSSLKRRYRDQLRAADPALRFAHLSGSREVIAQRMLARVNHYMPLSLLDSQCAALEPLDDDEAGLILDIRKEPAQLVEEILRA